MPLGQAPVWNPEPHPPWWSFGSQSGTANTAEFPPRVSAGLKIPQSRPVHTLRTGALPGYGGSPCHQHFQGRFGNAGRAALSLVSSVPGPRGSQADRKEKEQVSGSWSCQSGGEAAASSNTVTLTKGRIWFN